MSIVQDIEDLKPWFHNIHLPSGEQTNPNHFLGDFPQFKWEKIKADIPEDLSGWRVLDIGCNAGFYSVELAKRGAEVLAIDLDAHYLKQAKWIAKQFKVESQIQFKQLQVYDLAHINQEFDLVWFMGVFYHLRYPLLALDIISGITTKLLVFQTFTSSEKRMMEIPDDIDFQDRKILDSPGWPKLAFVPYKLAGDLTNWWVANHQGILSMLENCGFKVINMPEDEVYIAEIDSTQTPTPKGWNASEYLSAIGKDWKSEVGKKTGG